jgi:hypothetical protein
MKVTIGGSADGSLMSTVHWIERTSHQRRI